MSWRINKRRVKLYAGIMVVFALLCLLIDLSRGASVFQVRLMHLIWRLPYLFLMNVLLFEWAIPFIRNRRYWLLLRIPAGLLLGWAFLMLVSFGLHGWVWLGAALHLYEHLAPAKNIYVAVERQVGYGFLSILLFGVLTHAYDYRNLQQLAQQLRLEKKEAELNYLKAQTNPHFLFNTLNNIYALTRERSDKAPESVLRLSKILRFMLYEAGGDFIAIGEEIKVLDDYIELEKLRYDETLDVRFVHDLEDPRQAIPPLLLMPLVENAFKHGASETTGRPYVYIRLMVKSRNLQFSVVNPADDADGPMTENIGLSNLRRQLALLYADHELKVEHGANSFTATLRINLDSYV